MYIYVIIDDVDELIDDEIDFENIIVWYGLVGELIW